MNPAEQQLLFFSTLLQLEKQARHAEDSTSLIFNIVNDTIRLINYRQAILWQPSLRGNPKIKAISGIDTPDRNAPFVIYSHELLRFLSRYRKEENHPSEVRQFYQKDIPQPLVEGWQEWSLGFLLWCPLITPSGSNLGGIVFSRDTEWQEAEISLLQRLTETYAHSLAALQGRPTKRRRFFTTLPKRLLQIAVLLTVLLALDQKVHLSVLAPMQIVPLNPVLVTSPLASVIDDFFVEPNEEVKEGMPLFHLDNTATSNEYLVAAKTLDVMETEYKREKQRSFQEAQSRARLLSLSATIEQKKAEIAYISALKKRSTVNASQSGIAVFSDVRDWLGRPVAVGERIMTIADPQKVEVEIMLPVAEAINLQPGTEVQIFLNIKPDHPLSARLRQASYEATISKSGILSFRLKASFADETHLPRIGLGGTAKIYGEEVSMFYYLMRKPLIAIRQKLGI